jgi:hypothetical protein
VSTATTKAPAKKITHLTIALRAGTDSFPDGNANRGLLITLPQAARGEPHTSAAAAGSDGSFEVLPGHQPLTAFLPRGTTAAFGPYVCAFNDTEPPDLKKLTEVIEQGCLLSVKTDDTGTTVTIIPFGE